LNKPLILYADGFGDLPSYSFYGGTETLLFDQSKWSYYRVTPEGRELQAGVTSVVKIIDKSEVLMRWAVKKALEKLKKLLILGEYVITNSNNDEPKLLFETILDDIINLAKKADREELEAAGETGHAAHEWIENYIHSIIEEKEGRRLELLSKFPSDERAANAVTAALEWMHKHNVRWISTERRCFSRKYKYAGTADGLAIVDSCDNKDCCPESFKDRYTLVDWKTSNYLYIEYLLQTAAYQQAIQEESGRTIEDRWIIRLGKEDAEFDPWHVSGKELFDQDFQGFLNALALYRSVHKIEDRIDDIKEKKRNRAKELLAAERQLQCLDYTKYKGSRRKKGCNGTEIMCAACETLYLTTIRIHSIFNKRLNYERRAETKLAKRKDVCTK
jgi:hypothetical protein